MTLKKYLNLITILTGICWLIFVASIFLMDPETIGFWGFLLFYYSLFLSLLGSFLILGFIIRVRIFKGSIFQQVSISFRQSFWLSVIIVFLLVIKGLGLLHWWNFIIFILILIATELIIVLNRKRKIYNREK